METFDAMARKIGLSADERLHYLSLAASDDILVGVVNSAMLDLEDLAAAAEAEAEEAREHAAAFESELADLKALL